LRAAGVDVRGYDPRGETNPDQPTPVGAAAQADVVLSLTTAAEAEDALLSVRDVLREGQVYADANTGSASLKARLAELLAPTGAAFADVALMAPVPGRGLRTPALAAGAGAESFAMSFAALGMPVEVVGTEPGEAARLKLLRSVAWKGVAAVVLEAIEAARAAGREEWMRDELASLATQLDVDRMVEGSRTHARRRAHELSDVAAQLRELGVEPRMTEAAQAWLEDLRREQVAR
jgi:3-hydroxyisobutyrate dehydrogenase-like beta-hydroxyacid dehydrogenase